MAYTMNVTRGDTLTWRFTTGSDVTGWTPKFTIKPSPNFASLADGSAAVTATTGTGVVVTTPATGVIDVTISASVMAGLSPGPYVFDLQLTNGSLVRTVLLDGAPYGTLVLEPDVSRV